MIHLKQILTDKNKYYVSALATAIFMVLYSITGHIGYQNAQFLNMSSFERSIPFLEWTIWIYIVLYPIYIIWAIISYRDLTQMNKTLYSFCFVSLLSCFVFLLFPVTYPRELFPLSSGNSITTFIFEYTRKLDKPTNCLPSLHVGLCFIFAFGFLKESKKKFTISIIISVLIAISTLTTKQHYIVDLITSFFMTLITYLFIQKKITIIRKQDAHISYSFQK